MDKVSTWQVAVTVDHTGRQVPGLVFRDPEEAATQSYSYPKGYLWIERDDGSVGSIANDDGVIPYRERTQGEDEDLGLTWQLAK